MPNATDPISNMKHNAPGILTMTALFCLFGFFSHAATPPQAGDLAPDFALKTLDDQTVRLSDLKASGKVVLVVLRGWPGYQCPLCDRQGQDYIGLAAGFAEAKARVVFVYPGPADGLKAHAQEFAAAKGKQWPTNYSYVLDPDYTLVNAYGLRWDAPEETAYPATLVIDGQGVARFVKISRSHGDRTKAADILQEVNTVKSK